MSDGWLVGWGICQNTTFGRVLIRSRRLVGRLVQHELQSAQK